MLAVLVVSYLVLLRAFRSVVLPAKAVIMNLLSVSATYGVLVLAFQHGWGEPSASQQSAQIDGWIPIFLFAMLFGLSMDYEVFLLSRIREEWDRRHDNEHAIAYGLEHTGPHHHGGGDHHDRRVRRLRGRQLRRPAGVRPRACRSAILLDATVVRAILVPATMKLLGRLELVPARARPPRAAPAPAAGRAGARDRRFPLTPAAAGPPGGVPPAPAGMMAA